MIVPRFGVVFLATVRKRLEAVKKVVATDVDADDAEDDYQGVSAVSKWGRDGKTLTVSLDAPN